MRRLSKAWKEMKALKWISGEGSFQAEGATIDKVLRMMCPTQSRNNGRQRAVEHSEYTGL